MSFRLTLAQPAPATAVLELAPPLSHMRKLLLFQARNFLSVCVYIDGEPMAVAMFKPHSCNRLEMGLLVNRSASKHMRRLIRLTHLTIGNMAQTHLIFVRVNPDNIAGSRMAKYAGFTSTKANKHILIWRDA